MKKIGLIVTGISMFVLLLGSGVWADMVLTKGGGGSGFTYETSPNVVMDYGNATDAYWITSVNTKGSIEYGIVSDYSGYYQHTNEDATNATSSANSTIRGWTKAGVN